MIEAASNSTYLPYSMLITRLLEASRIDLTRFSSVSAPQCYNSRDFRSIGYMLVNSKWVHKDSDLPLPLAPTPAKASSSNPSSTMLCSSDVLSSLASMDTKMNGLKDLSLSQQFWISSRRSPKIHSLKDHFLS
ncbi:hypothetical protein K7X08_016655 [Anisodus acutangulus]|uniref:Uncharacterized protein n=1 Tax=Anisodus acutangulus TaxID=402998 RepID=A0A9Q1LFM5_9SOLA|nr:hypothetical protein K7X08_016655 [Anisodus acutangulus]